MPNSANLKIYTHQTTARPTFLIWLHLPVLLGNRHYSWPFFQAPHSCLYQLRIWEWRALENFKHDLEVTRPTVLRPFFRTSPFQRLLESLWEPSFNGCCHEVCSHLVSKWLGTPSTPALGLTEKSPHCFERVKKFKTMYIMK